MREQIDRLSTAVTIDLSQRLADADSAIGEANAAAGKSAPENASGPATGCACLTLSGSAEATVRVAKGCCFFCSRLWSCDTSF